MTTKELKHVYRICNESTGEYHKSYSGFSVWVSLRTAKAALRNVQGGGWFIVKYELKYMGGVNCGETK